MQEKLTCALDALSTEKASTVLFHRMQLVRIGEESAQSTPPPAPAEFPEIVQLVSLGEEFLMHCTPPPPLLVATFPEILQLMKVGDASVQYTPPPPPPLLRAELPQMAQLLMTGEESLQYTPPPAPSLPRVEFPQMLQRVMLGEEPSRQFTPLSPQFPEITQLVMFGEADMHSTPHRRFAVITQFSMLGEEPTQETPLPRLPVSVSPSNSDPGPSPLSNNTIAKYKPVRTSDIRIVVSWAPKSPVTVIALPRNVMGSAMTYSPGLTSTVSPVSAALIAGWISVKSPLPLTSTVMMAARDGTAQVSADISHRARNRVFFLDLSVFVLPKQER